jgi:hypothetical protein
MNVSQFPCLHENILKLSRQKDQAKMMADLISLITDSAASLTRLDSRICPLF